jgi:DNA-binding NarL/FixJ family response regulator
MAPTLRRLGPIVLRIAVSAAEALRELGRRTPDLVLLDLGLPDADGLAFGARIVREHPTAKVLALSAVDDPAAAEQAVHWGFHGYLTKGLSMDQLLEALRSALDGYLVVQYRKPGLRGARADAFVPSATLTERERDVLGLLTEGKNSREIARELFISGETVRTYVQGVLDKLGAHSRLEAVALARRHGVVRQPERQQEAWSRR